jgi:flagellar basal-body rod modification protein FlgD
MTIDVSTSGAARAATGTTSTTAANGELDKQAFLDLLVAQLRNQDPSSPMDTTEMMAQSTQLASMEQLSAMAETSRESFSLQMRIAAGGMVGQQIGYADADGTPRTGLAESVSFAGPVPMITVDGTQVPLDGVTLVRSTSTAPTTPSADASASPAA